MAFYFVLHSGRLSCLVCWHFVFLRHSRSTWCSQCFLPYVSRPRFAPAVSWPLRCPSFVEELGWVGLGALNLSQIPSCLANQGQENPFIELLLHTQPRSGVVLYEGSELVGGLISIQRAPGAFKCGITPLALNVSPPKLPPESKCQLIKSVLSQTTMAAMPNR